MMEGIGRGKTLESRTLGGGQSAGVRVRELSIRGTTIKEFYFII